MSNVSERTSQLHRYQNTTRNSFNDNINTMIIAKIKSTGKVF